MSTYTENYRLQSHTFLKYSEIPWHDAGCQVALEGTCQEKTRSAWTKIKKCIGSWEEVRPCRYTIT